MLQFEIPPFQYYSSDNTYDPVLKVQIVLVSVLLSVYITLVYSLDNDTSFSSIDLDNDQLLLCNNGINFYVTSRVKTSVFN